MPNKTSSDPSPIPANEFKRRFYRLILLAWVAPPVFGLSFLLFIQILTPKQIWIILTTPLQPVFAVGSLTLALWYFGRYARPLVAFLDGNETVNSEQVLRRMRQFPLHFWGAFLAYLVLAPSSVIISAERYTNFLPSSAIWFRTHLVALIVSIIVGLPIFFRILDLFGDAVRALSLDRAQITLKVKVFLIGALVPLLIDTMIVQYYWTRTGYFTFETFMVWLILEVLAVLGSLMFVRSFGQALQPMQGVLAGPRSLSLQNMSSLAPRSTDELGVLAAGYRRLLEDLNIHSAILRLSNRILRSNGEDAEIGEVVKDLLALCSATVGGDTIFLILHDPSTDELVGVAQSGEGYRPEGHFRLSLDDTSMAVWVFKTGGTTAITDVESDDRVSPAMRQRFGIHSALAAPMCIEDTVIGVLMSVSTCGQHDYSPEEVTLMEAFAREAALAVHTQMLYRERSEKEQQVRLLLDYTAEAIFGVDLNGNCTFVNPACLRMLGYSHETELLGKSMHELIHHTMPDGTPYPKERCQVRLATLNAQIGHSDEEVHWRADGSSFPVEYWSHPVYKEGNIIGSVVTFVDISERKKAEEELRQLSEYNRLLLESTGDGIFGVDEQMRCTFVNRAAAEMLGFEPQELKGKDMHALVHHTREDGSLLPLEDSLIYRTIHEDRSFWSDAEVLWHKSYESFPVQYSSNPIHERGQVRGAVVVFRNVAESRAMARKMDYLATHDALTGLFNRREFERRLEAALDTARRRGEEHVLCYMDLDQFKVVNDTCGHVAGDELLRQLTSLLHTKVRQADTLARLGGDEFGVLFENCHLEHAIQLCNELRGVVQDFRFVWEDKTFAVGASVGVVAITADTENVGSALSAADAACYMAKDSGRNRVHVYEADDAELARRRGEMQWVSRIHDALDHDRFELSYQSIVPLADSAENGGLHLEILIRMRGGDGGTVVPPGAFLPAAERYNLMPTIDRWVVGRTFEWLHQNRHELTDLLLCTINLSGHSITEEQFLDFVIDQVKGMTVPPDKICFEITETAAVANLSRAVRFMRELKEYGCRFALDDFGSGMSSFAYLKNLPVDFLKIDGNFVRDLARDPIDRAMVKAINQVGHVMGIRTIAEFAENDEIIDQLRKIGVDYAQGFGVSSPKPLAHLLSPRREFAEHPERAFQVEVAPE